MEASADVGVKQAVFELVFDSCSLGSIEDPMPILGSEQEWSRQRESCTALFELIDSALDLVRSPREWKQPQDGTPTNPLPSRWRPKTVAEREWEYWKQHREPHLFRQSVQTEVIRCDGRIVENQ
jgi:hypothetical protein